MARLKFFVFAVIAVAFAFAAFAASAVSASIAGASEASAGDAARYAALAAAGEVAKQDQVLTQAALVARTSPEVAAVVESAGFSRPGLTAAERLERLRVPVFAALPEELRSTARVWLVGDADAARATLEAPAESVGPAAPVPVPDEGEGEGEEGAATPAEALTGSDGSIPEGSGLFLQGEVPYLVIAMELTPARGRLLIGVPLRISPLDALVEGASGLSLVLMADGRALVGAGRIGADEVVSQVAAAPVGGSAPVLRRASDALGPLALPLFQGPAEQTVQRVGSRHALTGNVEVGTIVDLSRAQAQLAVNQKNGLYIIGALGLAGLLWTLLLAGGRGGKKPSGDGDSPPDSEPLRATLSVLPPDGGASPRQAAVTLAPPPADSPIPGPDDFPFPSERPAAAAQAEDDAAQALAAGGGGLSPLPPPVSRPLPPTPIPSAPPAYAAPPPPVATTPVAPAPVDPFGMVSQGSPADSYYGYGDDNPDATRVAAVPQELLQASASAMPANAGASAVARPLGGVPSVAAPAIDPEEQHFHDVFQEFIATRARCGEPSEGVTYDKFVAKLRKNRDQLVQKYACRTVRFQVYVKEGKAALKATPVKD